jgi:signal transduction histidine kinase
MFRPAPASFRAQAAIIAAASLAVVGLAAFIVIDVINKTEGALLADAVQTCVSACQELQVQYEERTKYGGDLLQNLPLDAQDLSLTGVSATVLRAFEGVAGGIYLPEKDRVMAWASPSEPSTSRPRPRGPRFDFIHALAERAAATNGVATLTRRLDTGFAIVGAAAQAKSGNAVVCTMKRASLTRNPIAETERWWLAVLVLFTLLGMLGIVSIWYMLHSGVAGIRRGLRRLEEDFAYRLPTIRGDLGQIAMAINGMAERRMALEEELRRQDRLVALGKVVSGVAHEVRNPLNSMKLTLQLLERRLKKGMAVSHEIEEALREIDRLDMIVGRLLAFGRPTMTDRQVQNLAPLVAQAMKMVQEPARNKGVLITVQHPGDALAVDVDGPQIVQVLINLLLNAIDASPPSGTVRVDAEHRERSVRVVVSDQGPGVAEEAKAHVFDAYYTTKPSGSGLGLAVSREIVANHGGELEFETNSSGTNFILLLPVDRSCSL